MVVIAEGTRRLLGNLFDAARYRYCSLHTQQTPAGASPCSTRAKLGS
jgi:hypothetical protein